MKSLFPHVVETDRLRLEPRSPDEIDVHELYRLCAYDDGVEEVTRYVPWEPHRTPKETQEFLERGWERFESGDGGPSYVVRPRDGEDGAGAIAGFASLRCDWDRRTASLGFWLRKRFWGRGYSGERAVALAELAFDVFDLDLLAVSCVVGNEKSKRAIEKYVDRLGGQHDCTIRNHYVWDGETRDGHRFTVSREQWRDAVGDERLATFRWRERERRDA